MLSVSFIAKNINEKRTVLLAFAASGINQIFGSATNLLIGIYLVRHMLPAEFGLYNIAFAITIAMAAIGNGVFLIPMTVNVPHSNSISRNRFLLDYIATSAVCTTAMGLIAVLGVAAAVMGGWLNPPAAEFILATIASCLGFFLKDAIVQAGYNQGRESATILINIASAVTVAILIIVSASLHTLSATWAIAGYALSQFISIGAGYILVFGRLQLPTILIVRTTMKKLLTQAFWPACASTLSLLRSQAHTVVAAALIGPAGVAAINASRLVFAPVQMAQPALVRAAMPRLVRRLHVDRQAFRRGTLAITGALGIFSFVYCLIVTAVGPWIFPLVVGPKYQYSSLMIFAWGIYLTLVALRSGIELNQQALQRFKGLAGVNVPASAASLLGAVVLTNIIGSPGAVFGLAIGEIVIIALLSFRMRTPE